LVVIGYSFRDNHVNHIINHWFTTQTNAMITIVGAPRSSPETNPFWQLHQAKARKRLFYDDSGIEGALSKLCGSE